MTNKNPSVLFLPKWYPHRGNPFDGNFVENHAHAVKQIANLKVLFVHSDDQLKDELYEFDEIDNEGIIELRVYFKRSSLGFSPIDRLINFLRYRKAQQLGYERLYPNSSPDLCHVHVLARSSFLAIKLKREKGIHFVITEHWSGYLPQSGALKASRKTPYYRRVANEASAINTVTQNLANAMKSHGVRNAFTVIPNVVNTSIFNCELDSVVESPEPRVQSPEKSEIGNQRSEKFTIEKNDGLGNRPSASINVLFVGNLLQHPKRILDIIQVFARISKIRQDFVLHIYGEGRDEGRMLLMIRDLGIQDFVKFHGTADRKGVADAMKQADFLFLYSEFENQPCVVNEALCCGCPVVVPDIEGIEEFMEDELGILFPRLKREAFENALLEMMDHYHQYDAEMISKKAAEKFSESSIANQFSVFYQSVLNKK